MKVKLVVLIVTLSLNLLFAQDNKVIKGRVISEELKVLAGILVFNQDSTIHTYADDLGNFTITVPKMEEYLVFSFFGMEKLKLSIKRTCENLEIVMMYSILYDFSSTKKINRKRYKRFKKLPKRHHEAHLQGVFKSEKPCIEYTFYEQ